MLKQPWDHIIIDDFLSKEKCTQILREAEQVYQDWPDNNPNNQGERWKIPGRYFKSEEFSNVETVLEESYVEWFKKFNLPIPFEVRLKTELSVCGNSFIYPIHTDTPEKL